MKLMKKSYANEANLPVQSVILASILIPVFLYFLKGAFLYRVLHLEDFLPQDVWAYNLQHLAFFVLFGLMPFLLYQPYFKTEKYQNFGLQWGDVSFGLKASAIGIVVAFLLAYFGSSDAAVLAEYPLPKSLLLEDQPIWNYHFFYFFFYYTAWEFFFRGIMLFSVLPAHGLWMSIAVQTLASTLEHIGKPAPEVLGAIPAGILFGWIAYRSRSVIYVFLIHALLGIFTDLWIIYGK